MAYATGAKPHTHNFMLGEPKTVARAPQFLGFYILLIIIKNNFRVFSAKIPKNSKIALIITEYVSKSHESEKGTQN